MAKRKPIIALMYDFDKTLCTKDMQEYTFIPKVGMEPSEFWAESTELSQTEKMDKILAYMYLMIKKAHAKEVRVKRNDFVSMGKDLEFYPGVKDWFDRINQLGTDLGVEIRHYIISSGLKEIIEGSDIYDEFDEVFACEFLYDEYEAPCWPKNTVNYTAKTQFLYRINKGVLDISDDKTLNEYTPEDERIVPFRNMIYIGDGITDVPCMKLVKVNGGFSIAVYPEDKIEKVKSLIKNERVNYIEPADYSEEGSLNEVVTDIICKMAMDNTLKDRTKEQLLLVGEEQ